MAKLSRGRLKAIEGELAGTPEGELEFMFNPTEYTISKTNSWTTRANKGRNVPKYEFAGGEPRQLQLELFFDPYLHPSGTTPRDLRLLLNRLFNYMMVDGGAQTKGPNSGMSQPPKCRLEWGMNTPDLAFECYVTSCQVKYTMFDEQGIPIRANATLALKEARDKEDLLPTNPTSRGEPGRRVWTVAEGDRLDWIAFQEYGDSTQWRRIAEANQLSNPLNLRPGMILAVPPL